jgi:hypothetical protein
MTIINLTPHPITLRSEGVDTVIAPFGAPARVSSTPGGLVDLGLPVLVAMPDTFGEVIGLPEPAEGVFFVVSAVVGAAVRGRSDVLVPGTGPSDGAVRAPDTLPDGTPNPRKGQVVAVTRLKRV